MKYPIPYDALDDRLGWVGTAGGGKTYNASAGVEMLLAANARVVIVDPLGVWFGLRLSPDGKTPSAFRPVIFGGTHGDLPINEHAGALVGETAASMAESAILDLSSFPSKAAERRFMLAFLTAFYRHVTGEPVHLVFDEADMWAPERMLDKEGDAAKLKGMMETIVRRGRVKGFIPWLITQRPAVISKDVLSQVDGLVAFKLTSSQDRDALGAWVEGQADREEWKRIRAELPTLPRGRGVVWMPARAILDIADFPQKRTFDSSRAPKRGEKRRATELQPIDLGALKDRLAKVEAETKANDPALLKARILELEREAAKKAPAGPSPEELRQAYEHGKADGYRDAARAINGLTTPVQNAIETLQGLALLLGHAESAATDKAAGSSSGKTSRFGREDAGSIPAPASKPAPVARQPAEGLTGPQQRILDAAAWFESIGVREPSRIQVAFVAGYTPSAGTFNNHCSSLRTAGLIDYPSGGQLILTDEGRAKARFPDRPGTTGDLHRMVLEKLNGPQRRLLEPLIRAYPGELDRETLATSAGYTASAGTFNNHVSSLRSLGLITYPRRGYACAAALLFLEG